jgi:hypothetical protein
MRHITAWFFRMVLHDSAKRIASARMTTDMINMATRGNMTHFYNYNGERIRGWAKKQYHFKNEMSNLEKKYSYES